MAKPFSSHEVFYPAAAAYAALALPLSVAAMATQSTMFPGLRHPAGHAHEMLVGFALAVVAGNQLGAVRPRVVATLLALWMVARAAFLVAPESVWSGVANAGFAGVLAWRVLPRRVGAAKKWRNRALPGVLAALCAMAAYWQVARHESGLAMPAGLILSLVALFALLMLFMGGRIVAPAVAGQYYHQGQDLEARVQPRIEAALLVAGIVTPLALAVPGGQAIAGVSAAASGVLALVRLFRWRLWGVQGRADLWCLASGYAWLGLGLVVFGAALASGRHTLAAAHVITVGALGTLTFNVMATFWTLRARRGLADVTLVVWGTALLAAATVLRLLGGLGAAGTWGWMVVAAACWSAAFVLLLVLFWRCLRAFRALPVRRE